MFPNDDDGIHSNESCSSISITESSSSGIESIDDDSLETQSLNSESLIIQSYDSSSSSSSGRRQVIIKPKEETKISPTKRQQRRYRKRLEKHRETPFFREKQLLLKNKSRLHSSNHAHRRSSYEPSESRAETLKRLYDEYSREDVHTDWKPLTFAESRQLCQYALDAYHAKFPSN